MKVARALGFVAVWIAIGYAMHALHRFDANLYLVIGVPLTIAQQALVRRRALLELWVRDPIEKKRWLLAGAIACAAAIFPVITLAHAHDVATILWTLCAVMGAVGLGFALVHMRRRDWKWFAVAMGTAGLFGCGLMVLGFLATVHFNHAPVPSFPTAMKTFGSSLALYAPACFMLEEVAFRPVVDGDMIDARLHVALFTAVVSSAAWGLWHLPTVPKSTPVLVAIPSLLVVHTIIGVPLALVYRRSGNLFVVGFTHAFIDAVRNALLQH